MKRSILPLFACLVAPFAAAEDGKYAALSAEQLYREVEARYADATALDLAASGQVEFSGRGEFRLDVRAHFGEGDVYRIEVDASAQTDNGPFETHDLFASDGAHRMARSRGVETARMETPAGSARQVRLDWVRGGAVMAMNLLERSYRRPAGCALAPTGYAELAGESIGGRACRVIRYAVDIEFAGRIESATYTIWIDAEDLTIRKREFADDDAAIVETYPS